MRINNNYIILGFILIIFILLIFNFFIKVKENYEDCPINTSIHDMPENAAEACKKIASRAEEIEANAKEIHGTLQNIPFYALFNPQNYKAGDNSSNDLVRNIINNNLSSCEINKIYNTCYNNLTMSQSIILDSTKCKYCQEHGCTISGTIQTNTAKASQTCLIDTAIAALIEKTGSVDAQALSKVLQKTEGILSGTNTSQTENCNIINQDLSSREYLEQKSECVNNLTITQSNLLLACGNLIGNVQKNESVQLQECMLGTKLERESKLEGATKTVLEKIADQSSKGVDTMTLFSSSLSCVILCIISAALCYFYPEYCNL